MPTRSTLEIHEPATDRLRPALSAATTARVLEIQGEIERLGNLAPGWDGYSTDAASPLAMQRALATAESLCRLDCQPIKAAPLSDGGIALIIMALPYYVALEIYNDGETVAAFSDRKRRQLAWGTGAEEAQLKETVERFHALMHG